MHIGTWVWRQKKYMMMYNDNTLVTVISVKVKNYSCWLKFIEKFFKIYDAYSFTHLSFSFSDVPGYVYKKYVLYARDYLLYCKLLTITHTTDLHTEKDKNLEKSCFHSPFLPFPVNIVNCK